MSPEMIRADVVAAVLEALILKLRPDWDEPGRNFGQCAPVELAPLEAPL